MEKKELIEFLHACDSETVRVRKDDDAVPIACGWVADGDDGEKLIILEI